MYLEVDLHPVVDSGLDLGVKWYNCGAVSTGVDLGGDL